MHIFVYHQRLCNDISAVKFGTYNTGADGISVKSYQQIEQSGTVAHFYDHITIYTSGYFFGKVKGIVFALLKRKERVILQFLRKYLFFVCKRVMRADKYMRLCGEQLVKFQTAFFDYFADDRFIFMREVQYPDFAAEIAYVFNYFAGFGFTQGKVV